MNSGTISEAFFGERPGVGGVHTPGYELLS
jgi:hypothetical protein